MNAGDLVQLKSGGPTMTIRWIEDGEAFCEWFDGKKVVGQPPVRVSILLTNDGSKSVVVTEVVLLRSLYGNKTHDPLANVPEAIEYVSARNSLVETFRRDYSNQIVHLEGTYTSYTRDDPVDLGSDYGKPQLPLTVKPEETKALNVGFRPIALDKNNLNVQVQMLRISLQASDGTASVRICPIVAKAFIMFDGNKWDGVLSSPPLSKQPTHLLPITDGVTLCDLAVSHRIKP
jgi:uncharacterized protein YodC (DUF2158 family)